MTKGEIMIRETAALSEQIYGGKQKWEGKF